MNPHRRLTPSELRYLSSLAQKKFRQREKKFLLEGWRPLKDALNAGWKLDLVSVLTSYAGDPDYGSILGQAAERKIPVKEISERELAKVSMTVHAQGVVAVAHQRAAEADELLSAPEGVLILTDRVTDPGNLGTLIRTGDWFGARGIVLGKGSVELYNEKVIRAAIGSMFHLPIAESIDLPEFIAALKAAGAYVVALSADGSTPFDEAPPRHWTALVVGSEAHGISADVRGAVDDVLKIPRYGRAESLNVGVACGIILAHIKVGQRTTTR
jgi:TrmH family RNA methyltransferase